MNMGRRDALRIAGLAASNMQSALPQRETCSDGYFYGNADTPQRAFLCRRVCLG